MKSWVFTMPASWSRRASEPAPMTPEVIRAILAAGDALASNGFIRASLPFDEEAWIFAITPLGSQLLDWLDDEARWRRLQPLLDETLGGTSDSYQPLSADTFGDALARVAAH